MPDQESSQQRSAWSARSYDGLREPGETERCSQDLPALVEHATR
jgi:hypothetical protein